MRSTHYGQLSAEAKAFQGRARLGTAAFFAFLFTILYLLNSRQIDPGLHQDAYRRGQDAYQQGRHRSANPHSTQESGRATEYEGWIRGYMDAAHEHKHN